MTESVRYATEDGTSVEARLSGAGPHAVLLARAAEAPATVWDDVAPEFAAHGLTVLVPAFRDAADPATTMADIAAGVAFLRGRGAAAVSVIGATTGAEAAAEAVLAGMMDGLHTLILIAPERLSGEIGLATEPVIFVVADEDLATVTAMKQRGVAPFAVQVTMYAGDFPSMSLFGSPHRGALLKLLKGALPADPLSS